MRGHVLKRCKCSEAARRRCKHKWAYVVDVGRNENTGKRQQKWVSGFATKREADNALTKARGILLEGRDPFPKEVTVREFMSQWLDHWKTQVRPKTWYGNESLTRNHVVPAIGHLRMTSVRPTHVIKVLEEMSRRGLASNTRVHAHAAMSKAFASAIKWGVVSTSPVREVERPKGSSPELLPPTSEQLLQLLKKASGTPWEVPLLLSMATGARRSEVLAMRWSDVDRDRRRVRINRSLQQLNRDIYFADTKTNRARRELSLPVFAVERLREHRVEQKRRRLELGFAWQGSDDHTQDLLCEAGRGQVVRPDSYSDWYRRNARRLGLTNVRLHAVRHFYATQLLSSGVHPKIASAALGHASEAFTQKQYQHMLDGMTEPAADAIDAALWPEPLANRLQGHVS